LTKRAPLAGLQQVTALPPVPVRLDAVDRRLLTLLAADSRVSQRRLSRELRMSPPAIGERIARLERAGVIRGYTVKLDWSALGFSPAYLAVTAVQGADQASIMRALHALPEVEDVVVITGSIDMLARVRVRDHAHLRQLLLEQVWQIDGLQRTETFLCLGEMPDKDFVAQLLSSLDAADTPATRSEEAAR
jgi:DNA-binding Lrp family transcriptional regulator